MKLKANLLKAFAITAVLTIPAVALTFPVAALSNSSALDSLKETRCERVTNRVNTRISRYDENKNKHIQRYENIKNAVTNLINKLSEKGYDVSEVSANLKTFDSMIKQTADDYTVFIDKLKESKTYACGNSEGQFKATIEDALTKLSTFREQAKKTIDFAKNTLRPSIQKLKEQKPKATNS